MPAVATHGKVDSYTLGTKCLTSPNLLCPLSPGLTGMVGQPTHGIII